MGDNPVKKDGGGVGDIFKTMMDYKLKAITDRMALPQTILSEKIKMLTDPDITSSRDAMIKAKTALMTAQNDYNSKIAIGKMNLKNTVDLAKMSSVGLGGMGFGGGFGGLGKMFSGLGGMGDLFGGFERKKRRRAYRRRKVSYSHSPFRKYKGTFIRRTIRRRRV
jgi:hypothetical protein